MSTADWFENFNLRLKISEETNKNIENFSDEIKKIIDFEYKTNILQKSNTFFIGPYGRKTAIDTNTIEMIVEVPLYLYKRYELHSDRGPIEVLNDVNKKIKKIYINSRISDDNRLIEVEDKGILYLILPVFKEKNSDIYIYPNALENSWEKMNPMSTLNAFEDLDKNTNGNFTIFTRMIKYWNNLWYLNLEDILVDSIVYEFFSDYKMGALKGFTYYDCFSIDFFNYLLEKDENYYWSIPGTKGKIRPNNYAIFFKEVEKSRNMAKRATDLYIDNNKILSKEAWQLLYGEEFSEN